MKNMVRRSDQCSIVFLLTVTAVYNNKFSRCPKGIANRALRCLHQYLTWHLPAKGCRCRTCTVLHVASRWNDTCGAYCISFPCPQKTSHWNYKKQQACYPMCTEHRKSSLCPRYVDNMHLLVHDFFSLIIFIFLFFSKIVLMWEKKMVITEWLQNWRLQNFSCSRKTYGVS
jgi:hypothetical protein